MSINPALNRARGWTRRGTMNGTERAYSEHLTRTGLYAWIKYEGVKLRLADNTFYTPDFFVMTKDFFLEAHEVKGFWQEAARVRIKVAAEMYPIKFKAIKKVKGQWSVEEF